MSDVVDELDDIIREEDWDRLAAVLDDRLFAYLASAPGALQRALEAAPDAWLRDHPRSSLARSLLKGSARSLGVLDDRDFAVFRAWVRSQHDPATRDRLAVATGTLRDLLAAGRVDEASTVATEIFATIDGAADTAGFHDVLAPVLLRAGTAKLLAGDVSAAIAAFAEARRWAGVRELRPFEPVASRYLALAYSLAGNHAAADRELHRAGVEVSEGLDEWIAVFARASIALGRLDREEAARWVPQASVVQSTIEMNWVRTHIRARHALYWGDRELSLHEVEDHLVTNPSLTRPGSMAGDQLRADLADLYQALGNLPAAEHVLATSGIRRGHRSVLTSRSRLHVLKGEHDEALTHLAEAEQSTGGRVHFAPNWRVLQASAGQYLGDPLGAESLGAVARTIQHLHAFDALVDGSPGVRDEIVGRLTVRPASLPDVYPPPPTRATLTPRERDVLQALHEHTSVKTVAAALHVSPNTAKTHLRALYRKLGVTSREQALRITSPGHG